MVNEPISIGSEKRVEEAGIVDVDSAYKISREFLKKRGYKVFEIDTTLDYSDDNKLKGFTVKVDCFRQKDDLWQIEFEYNLSIKTTHTKKIKENGKDREVNYGSVFLTFNIFLHFDYMHKFQEGPISKMLLFIYNIFFRNYNLNQTIGIALGDRGYLKDTIKGLVEK